MLTYLLLCRSLTYAQRSARILNRAGLSGQVGRVPKSAAAEGCGYCVRIRERDLASALGLLRREGLGPQRVYLQTEEDPPREVEP